MDGSALGEELSGAESQEAEQRALKRDQTAAARDRAAAARDAAAEHLSREKPTLEPLSSMTGDELRALYRSFLSARSAANERAASDRAQAARDRRFAADDRRLATAYRAQARLAVERAHCDSLTGAQRRDLGDITLRQEIDRSRRSSEPFVLAFVDVDGLKRLNDTEGHAAGDALLKAVVSALRAGRRSYDQIVRIGGDEFLCGFSNTTLEDARRRVEEIRQCLEKGRVAASISVGLATLGTGDTLEKLIARADADMYSSKHGRTGVSDRRQPAAARSN